MLEELAVSVVAPVRGLWGIVAFFALGPKRSGDIYTSADVAWLSTLADRLAVELFRFGDSPSFTPAAAAQAKQLPRRSPFVSTPTPDEPAADELPTLDIISSAAECPLCGVCYDAGVSRCVHDGVAITRLRVPRHLVNRYRLDRRLGRGGMGTVYQATDTSLERSVAVKIIRENPLGASDTTERFRKEARTTAAFAHPNVVTVFDFGVVDGTVPFLVLELLRGASLRDELAKRERFEPERTKEILKGVCAALTAAHQKDLVHRDRV